MFDVGGGELILIVLAILVLFGPKKIPEIAHMFSKGMKKVREAQAQFQSQLREFETEVKKTVDFDVENPETGKQKTQAKQNPREPEIKKSTKENESPENNINSEEDYLKYYGMTGTNDNDKQN